MRKICLIIHSIGVGGMERVMRQLAISFSERNDTKIDLILIGRKREIIFSLPESIKIHRPSFNFDNKKRIRNTLKTILFLRKKVKEINPDRILSFGEYWNNLVLLTLYGLAYSIFISDRSEPGKDLGKFQNFLRNKLYPKARGYIAQTQEAKRVCLARAWNNNVKVIGNPIRKIDMNNEEKKENIVLSVGRLIKTKHFDQLIRMFVEIGNTDWKLVIVGGDSKKQNLLVELNQLVKDMGACGSVFLEGEQKNIDAYYNKSSIFAFSSSSEGFPNVIGEALSAGLPVVCYDNIAGPSDMIENGVNGFLVPANDVSQFKRKLSLLMMDEDLRNSMSEQSCKYIKHFNLESISSEYFTFLFNN